ncbi:hypothetical protein M569_17739 [Genlisea aurea]|uniref:Uncharacterized protein n=1 Tax=Genlisea aurea TaxID=192259 RepID=S8BY46_9LAMI|nr:hypothetical protein M569_17739 [Genlisea aurea]
MTIHWQHSNRGHTTLNGFPSKAPKRKIGCLTGQTAKHCQPTPGIASGGLTPAAPVFATRSEAPESLADLSTCTKFYLLGSSLIDSSTNDFSPVMLGSGSQKSYPPEKLASKGRLAPPPLVLAELASLEVSLLLRAGQVGL